MLHPWLAFISSANTQTPAFCLPVQLLDFDSPTLTPRAPWVGDQLTYDPLEPDFNVSAVLTTLLVLDEGVELTDPGATASDAVDGDVSNKVSSLYVSLFRGSCKLQQRVLRFNNDK